MKFKAQEQYFFGKLHDSNTVKFIRTPKRQIYLGADLEKREIYTFADFYAKNPCNYAVGDNISICIKDKDGQMKELMSKTILEPVKLDNLSDEVTPLHQQNMRNQNEDLVKSYQGSIDYLQTQLKNLSASNQELANKAIEQAQTIAEGDVEFERLEEKYKDLKAEFEAHKKEFGEIIREARNPSPPSLGDRLGEMAATPEVMGALSELVGLGVGWLRNKTGNNPANLNDRPPAHQEQTISEDESEVFSED